MKGVGGTWKDLTDSVNFMAGNLTDQVRGIARVVTAVANGDLKQKLLVDAKGEIAELAATINSMTETLGIFADQTTTVAREVGVEGKLGGQASVPGAAGTWRDLTDNVNQLAANLTTQLRAIADVATAVTKGDLTRSIQVDAQGEVAFVKDNINEMIGNLRDTTSRNNEQDWLKTNLAKFTRMLQGQKDLLTVGRMILSELAPVVSAQQGVFYIMDGSPEEPELKLLASYAYRERKGVNNRFRLGEGLVGQAALEKERILLTNVPQDYVHISSGLGEAPPVNIVVLPILFEGQVKAVMELSSVERFNPTHQAFLDQLTESIGIVLNTIEANTLTEDLLKQSQSLAGELQSRQEELQTTNQELEQKARQLFEQNEEVEKKNREVEQARQALEGKAQQLSLTSRYKSEFLANMSHELRTPLNSLLILAEQLSSNPEGNLTPKQVEFARTIRGSGKDLLKLINDILDLSKIESGTVTLDVGEVRFEELRQSMERTFRHVAEDKGISFTIAIDANLPTAISTDAQRLEQVLKNLLSNAFKFTERGYVNLRVGPATEGWSEENGPLNQRGRRPRLFRERQRHRHPGRQTGDDLRTVPAGRRKHESEIRRHRPWACDQPRTRARPRRRNSHRKPRRSRKHVHPLPAAKLYCFADGEENPRAGRRPRTRRSAQWRHANPGAVRGPGRSRQYPAGRESGPHHRRRSRLRAVADGHDARQRLQGHCERAWKRWPRARAGVLPIAVLLDLSLPDITGWKVLDRLKNDLKTRHIPVFIISANEEPENALKQGALRFLTKPVAPPDVEEIFAKVRQMDETDAKQLLVIEDDENQRNSIRELIGNETAHLTDAATAEQALQQMDNQRFDCVVLDLMLPDMSGFELINKIRAREEHLPIIVYTGKDLSREEEEKLNRMAQTTIVKDVRSPERLFDQTALWLHREISRLPEGKREILQRLHDPDAILAGKKVLIVDDDIRNIFAMTSMLERYKMDVQAAETGKAAIGTLQSTEGIDLVLMDIMLPEMDGYETMRTIRSMYGFASLPIIAVTAKAMKGDREKCIEAGASDYISKPVDTERLLTLLRSWLHR